MNCGSFDHGVNTLTESQIDECLIPKYSIENLMSELIEYLEKNKTKKRFQKLILLSLQLLSDNLKLDFLKNQTSHILKLNTISEKMQQNQKKMDRLRNEIVYLCKQLNNKKERRQKQIFEILKQYRNFTLEYAETILNMCHSLSYGEKNIYEHLLLTCGRYFISLQQNFTINQLLQTLIQPIEGFDPLLLKLKVKKGELKTQLEEILKPDLQFSLRLINANEEIQKSTKEYLLKKQLKINFNGLKGVLNKYHFDETEKSKQSQKKINNPTNFSLNIKNHSQKQKVQKNQECQKRIFENFRKKKFREKLAKSLDIKCSKMETQSNSNIQTNTSTQIIMRKRSQNNQQRTNLARISKRLNFKGIQLEPLQKKNNRVFLSLNKQKQSQFFKGDDEVKNTHRSYVFNKNYRKIHQFSNRTQHKIQDDINEKKFSQYCMTPDNKPKKQTFRSKRLQYIISKRRHHSIDSQEDQSSQFSDQSSEKNVFSSNLTKKFHINRRLNLISKRNEEFTNRKSEITQVDEKSCQDLSKNLSAKHHLQPQNHSIETNQSQKVDDLVNLRQQNSDPAGRSIQLIQLKEQIVSEVPQGVLNIEEIRPPEFPQPSGQLKDFQHKTASSLDKESLKNKASSKRSEPYSEREKRKIILKAPKLILSQIPTYLQKFEISQNAHIFMEIQKHQHYINEFYLNDSLFCIIILIPSLNLKQLHIRSIHEVESSQFADAYIKQKIRKIMMRNFVDLMKKSSDGLKEITSVNVDQKYSWLSECGFVISGSTYTYLFDEDKKETKKSSKQFLSLDLSILRIKQSVNESFLYSDDICTFKNGKYDVDEKIFTDSEFQHFTSDFDQELSSLTEVNQVLDSKELDIFESNEEIQDLIQNESQNEDCKMKLKIFAFNEVLNRKFIVSNGWIKTSSNLVFNDKNKIISQFPLSDNYELYFGRGFEHIGTMKNKILHYKTRTASSKTPEQPKEIATKIRMFSKQLYGLIKQSDGVAFYGNWELNFHFKHEFIGKVGYSIDTQNKQNRLVFGNSSFFVTVYHGDQFLVGWEIEENDFLY